MERKHKLYASIIGVGVALFATVLATRGVHDSFLFGRTDASDLYSLELSKNNRYVSGNSETKNTAAGNPIVFNFSNCSSVSNNFVKLNNGGSFSNNVDSPLHYITSITPVFSASTGASLKVKASYDATQWGLGAELTSNQTFDFNAKPHYLEFSAAGGDVTVESLSISFECINEEPETKVYQKVTEELSDYSGEYLIVYEEGKLCFDGSLETLEAIDNYARVEIENNQIAATTDTESYAFDIAKRTSPNEGYSIKSKSGYYIGSSKDENALKTSASDTYENDITFDENKIEIFSSIGTALRYNKANDQNRFRFFKTASYAGQQPIALYKANKGGSTDPIPVYNTKITYIDNKANNYAETDVFNNLINNGGLTVSVENSKGEVKELKASDFTYTIKDSNGSTVDGTKAFNKTGTFTVSIHYGQLSPITYQIVVSEVVIESHMKEAYEAAAALSVGGKTSTKKTYTGTIVGSRSNGTNTDYYIQADGYGIDIYNPGTTLTVGKRYTIQSKLQNFSNIYETYETVTVSDEADSVLPNDVLITSKSQLGSTNQNILVGATGTVVNHTTHEGISKDYTLNLKLANEDVIPVFFKKSCFTQSLVSFMNNLTDGDTVTISNGIRSLYYNSSTRTTTHQIIASSQTTYVKGQIDVTGVTVSPTSVSVHAGKTTQLTASVLPTDATNKKVTWSVVSGSSYASVDQTGLVTGTNEGSAVVKVTSQENSSYYAECEVTVTPPSTDVESVTISGSNSVEVDHTINLSATVLPEIAKNKNVTWSISSGSSYASVSNTGVVTGIAVGKATVKAASQENPSIFDTKEINVVADSTKPTSITISGSNSVEVNHSTTLTATVLPASATDKSVIWSIVEGSSNISLSSGTVTGVKEGNAKVRATSNAVSSVYGEFNIKVEADSTKVTSVTLSPTSATVYLNATKQLTATVLPETATNKNVLWSSNNESVATVSSTGLVTAKALGNATITVTTQEGGKTATCAITVSKEPSVASFTIESSDAPATYETDTEKTIGDYTYVFNNVGNSYTAGYMQFKKSVSYLYNKTAIEGLVSISIDTGDKSWGGSVYYGTEKEPLTNSATKTDGKYLIPSENSYFNIVTNGSTGYIKSITIEYSTEPVNPTGISIPSTASVSVNGTTTLDVTYSPTNCNTNKGVTWKSSNTSVATVNATTGVITGVKAGTSTITATSTFNDSFKSTCTLTVSEKQIDKWTLLIYMCGADLESDYADDNDGCATDDLKEIYSKKSGMSDDVNIVVQAGGSKAWSSEYSSVINKDSRNRFHLTKTGYVKDSQVDKVNMGLDTSLEDFVEWGLETYPADKVGLVLWNHGGAMGGCCYDEQFGDDNLTPAEVASAIPTAISNSGYNKNLEFIGYDCCLMSVQDIAGLNADYANYMIASEESEWGYGWSYDKFVDKIMSNKSTETILKACVDGFAEDTASAYASWEKPNDQTLAYYNLQNWSAYETAWENFAEYLNNNVIKSSSNWSTFTSVVNSAQKYGYNSEASHYNDGYVYDIFDVKDFLNKIKVNNNYKSNTQLMSKVSDIESAFTGLGVYSRCGSAAGNSYGLCMFCPISGYNEKNGEYASANTTLSKWRSLCVTYGKWYK